MTPGLIFDMDDTLYPERQFVRSGFRAVAIHVERHFGVPSPRVLAELLRCLRHGGRRLALQSMCLECDVPLSSVPDLVDVIRRHRPALRLPVASVDTLARARASGWRVGVLTNGLPDIQSRKVRALGLDHLVDAVVYAQEWGSGLGKPELESFDVVLSRLGTAQQTTVFVGDDPWCDIVGARRAGLLSILIGRAPYAALADTADRLVTDISQVLPAAASLLCCEVEDAA
jgi:putative hydrolase of the HAD superfamily